MKRVKQLTVRFPDKPGDEPVIEFKGDWTGADIQALRRMLPRAYELWKRVRRVSLPEKEVT